MGLTSLEIRELALHKARVELSHRLIQNTISLEDTAWLALEPVMRMTDSPAGYVSYIDTETKENVGFLHVPEMTPCSGSKAKTAIRFPIKDGSYNALWGHSLNSHEGFFTNDPSKHPSSKGLPVGHFPLHSFLSVPVSVGKLLLGQIAVANKVGGFTEEDLYITNLFGELYGLALHRKFSEQALIDAERNATVRLERRLKAFMNATPDRLHIVNSEGFILDSHMGNLPFVVKNAAGYIGKNVRDIFLGGDIAEQMLAHIQEALQLDGKPLLWEYSLPQLPDHVFEGHLIKSGPNEVMIVVREVTQAKFAQLELERKVQERTQALEQSNTALQSFAYAASHDLQEPLNKIQAYGTRFKQTHPDLDAKGQEYLGVMITAAERLSKLVEDLLMYSKAGGQDENPATEVSLNAVLNETISNLEESVKRSGAKIEVGTLPSVHGHSNRLQHVFQNILSNAIKFHKPGKPPSIQITGHVEGSQAVVQIQDDGIGFDPTYKEKIFTIFNRLHTRFDYPGTGVGLALCRRIIAQYGGTVEANSHPNEGATFTIQLPNGV